MLFWLKGFYAAQPNKHDCPHLSPALYQPGQKTWVVCANVGSMAIGQRLLHGARNLTQTAKNQQELRL